MRGLASIFWLVPLAASAFTFNDTAKTVQTDGTRTDTVNGINYADGKNQDGWVITVGSAGGSYSWAGGISIPSTYVHSYTLRGAGSGSTRTIIDITSGGGFSFLCRDGKIFRLSGFIFRGNLSSDYITIDGWGHNAFRIDNCRFEDVSTDRIVEINENVNNPAGGPGPYGLFDHCDFLATASHNGIYIHCGTDSASWTTAHSWGQADAVYIEDCTFQKTGVVVEGNPAVDSSHDGARWTLRYCFLTNWVCVAHGADSAPTSTLQVELYNNYFRVNENVDYAYYHRGGTAVMTDNNIGVNSGGDYNSAFKFAQDEVPTGFQSVGEGVVNGAEGIVPVYIWNNTVNGAATLISDAGVPLNTRYFLSARPGYTKFTYPHPLTGSQSQGDTNAPTPNPMTFATVPAATGSSVITMTATSASDASTPVEYLFDETTGNPGATDSGWQTSASYTDTGLSPQTQYTYRVKARDSASPTQNETAYSSSASATTTAGSFATYYVDQTAGLDTNPGTQASPWKNCPGMAGTSAHTGSGALNAGDTVYFDKGDTWNVSSAGGGGFELVGGVHYIGNVFGTGTRAKIRANGLCEAGVVRFIADSGTNITWFERFEVDGNSQSATGIDINHRFWSANLRGAIKRIEGCYVHDLTGDGGGAGTFRYGIIVSDGSSDTSGFAANVEILDTEVARPARDGICLYPGSDGMISNVLVRGSIAHGIKNDPSYNEGHGILIKGLVKNSIVEYCISSNNNSSAVFINGPEPPSTKPGPTNCTVRYNILHTLDNNGVIRFFGTGDKTLDIYGNIVLSNTITGGLSFGGCSGTMNVKIYNNTFWSTYVNFENPSSTGTLHYRNNIVRAPSGSVPFTDAGQDVDTHSNNLYYRPDGGTLVSHGGSTFTSATLTSWEASAFSANPLFTSETAIPTAFTGTYPNFVPNQTGLKLQDLSVGLNAAVNLGNPYTNSINSQARTAPYDIGAWESTGAGNPPLIISSTNSQGTNFVAFTNYTILTDIGDTTQFAATNLPAGLTLDTISGIISGTFNIVNADATNFVGLFATNPFGTGYTNMSMVIKALGTPVITSAASTTATNGTPFQGYTITATQYPTNYGASGLPVGLTLDTTTGVISGTPTVDGTINSTIYATNQVGNGSQGLQFVISNTTPVLQVTPSSLTFTEIAETQTNTLTFGVTNMGGGTLTGNANATAAPFTVLAPTNWSLAAGLGAVITVQYAPTSKGTNTANVIFDSNAADVTNAVTGVCYPLASSWTFTATNGLINAPFVGNAGANYVSQTNETAGSPEIGGRCVFGFTVTNAGTFTFSGAVSAADTSTDSFYFNVNAEPADPAHEWNINGATAGFVAKDVTWDSDLPLTTAHIFTFQPGIIKVVIRGREANAQLRSITMSQPIVDPIFQKLAPVGQVRVVGQRR